MFKPLKFAVLTVCLFGLTVFCLTQSFAQRLDDSSDYEKSLQENSAYSQIVGLLRKNDQKVEQLKLQYHDLIILTIADILFSLITLIAALALPGKKTVLFKGYVWFIFIFNFTALILFFFFKGLWFVLYYFVIDANRETAAPIRDSFYFFYIGFTLILYVWLLARTFALGFVDALKTFFVSQSIFFLLVAIIVLFIPKSNKWAVIIKDNITLPSRIGKLTKDIDIITEKKPVLAALRVRGYHP